MSRLATMLAVRPGEGRTVALIAAAFAAVECGRGLGEVGVDTIVLSQAGAQALPPLYIGLGLTGLVTTFLYGASIARARRARFFPSLLLVIALVLAAGRVAMLALGEAASSAVWIVVYLVGALLVTVMWTVASIAFDARRAKRLFPLCTAAAIAGSFIGLTAAGPVAGLLGASNLVLLEAILCAVAAGSLSRLGGRLRPAGGSDARTTPVLTALSGGARYVAGSPLLRAIALAYLLFAVLLFSVSYPFLGAMAAAFPDETALATALGLFSATVTGVSFLVATLIANRLLTRFGVASVAILLPVVYVLGFGLWLVRFTLATALAVRFVQQVTQRGLSNATWSAFFTVIPAGRRGPALAFIDGVPGQLGTVISGVLLILATGLASGQVYLMGLVASLVLLAVVLHIRGLYATSLVRSLREAPGEQVLEGGPGIDSLAKDPRVIAELVVIAGSERTADRELAAQMLGRLRVHSALPDLERLASDPEAAVRRAAVTSLAELADPVALPTILAMTEDPDPMVRAAAVAGLGDGGVIEAVEAIALLGSGRVDHLGSDPSPLVRSELAVLLARGGDRDRAARIVAGLLASSDAAERAAGLGAMSRLPDLAGAAEGADLGSYLDALDDRSLEVRRAASAVLRARPDAAPALMQRLVAGSPNAQGAALAALEGNADPIRDPLVAWAEGRVGRATDLRREAASLVRLDGTGCAAYLAQVLRIRGAIIEEQLLAALAILGAPEAGGLIRRCLHAIDPDTRAQAIEALELLGDPRLARDVAALLDVDDAPAVSVVDPSGVCWTLLEDPDPWVRALAARTLSESGSGQQQALVDRLRLDPEPLVRAAVKDVEEDLAVRDGGRMLGDIDRMLILRRVPLFAALAPEDLQRVAGMAHERAWPPGEAIMTEGDVGRELVVIIDGQVRVVHRQAQGDLLLTAYGPGDHIGELAVLREAPRAANVIAEEPGVRGLSIDGEALRSILLERPQAAMAMLATLADRISRQ